MLEAARKAPPVGVLQKSLAQQKAHVLNPSSQAQFVFVQRPLPYCPGRL